MNDKNVESFALGVIIVLLAWFLLEKKSGGHAATASGSRSAGKSGGGGCGSCSTDSGGSNLSIVGSDGTPQAPIALGLNPLNPEIAYGGYQKTGFKFA